MRSVPLRVAFLLLMAAALSPAAPASAALRCDQSAHTGTPSAVIFGGEGSVRFQLHERYCSVGANRGASLRGLKDADGRRWIIPQKYHAILILSSIHSVVQIKTLDGSPGKSDGWYLYLHGKGPGPKLPYEEVNRLPGGREMVVAVGETRVAPMTAGDRQVGLITSLLTSFKPLEVYGTTLSPRLTIRGDEAGFRRLVSGERWAVERYGDNAIVAHRGPDRSQMLSLAGEPLGPVMSRINLFGAGRDAVVELVQLQHPDLPPPDVAKDYVLGRPISILYLPLDSSGRVMAMPPGAIGVMMLVGDTEVARTATGWVIVYPKGSGFEVSYAAGSVESVLRNAASLPRYAGFYSDSWAMAVKEPSTGYWNILDRRTLAFDSLGLTSNRTATGAVDTFKQRTYRKQEADRQAALARAAAVEAERRRLAEAAARARDLERERLAAVFAATPCQWEMRRAVWMLGAEAERRFYSECGMYSPDDFASATRAGVDPGRIREARARSLWLDPAGAGRQQVAISSSTLSGVSSAWGPASGPVGAQYGTYGAQQQRYAWEAALKKQVGF